MGLKQLSEAQGGVTQIGNASSISIRGKMPHKDAPGGIGLCFQLEHIWGWKMHEAAAHSDQTNRSK